MVLREFQEQSDLSLISGSCMEKKIRTEIPEDEYKEIDLAKITLASTITLEALLQVLEKKGIVRAEEVVNEIRIMRSGSDKKFN